MAGKIIYKGPHYIASEFDTAAGKLLTIERTKRLKSGNKGVYLKGADAEEWIDAIKTAIDNSEAAALCKALLN